MWLMNCLKWGHSSHRQLKTTRLKMSMCHYVWCIFKTKATKLLGQVHALGGFGWGKEHWSIRHIEPARYFYTIARLYDCVFENLHIGSNNWPPILGLFVIRKSGLKSCCVNPHLESWQTLLSSLLISAGGLCFFGHNSLVWFSKSTMRCS